MSLNDKISAEITAAMRAKDAPKLSALRMLKAAIMNKGVEKGRDLEDPEVLQVADLVQKETGDLAVLEAYLPPAAGADEIEAAVGAAIAETGASSAKDMGKVMKAVMPKLAGKNADGKAVNDAVRRKLGA
jgi:uncharacterized protein YqeY